MTSRKFYVVGFLAVLVAWFACPSFSYELSFKRNNDAVNVNTSVSVASEYCAFLILKASLEKNNIPYSFNTNGLYYSVNGYEKTEAFQINGHLLNLTGYDYNSQLILWPRDPLDRQIIDCDYSLVLSAGEVRPNGDTSPLKTFVYYDYGVVRLTNWIGDYLQVNGAIDFSTKQIDILSNVSNSMPILMSDKYINYFSNRERIYNITFQNSGSMSYRSNLKNRVLGSMSELATQISTHLLYLTGSTNSYFRTIDSYSLQTNEIMYQSQLPWQLQFHNNDYVNTEHLQPLGLGAVDTDEGTEPDWSEYFNAHDFEYMEDDWGQPADIGGSGSGAGGEITSYGPQAQQTMMETTENALENYFGDDDSVTSPTLPSVDYEEELDDPDTTSEDAEGFLETAKTELEDDIIDAAPGVAKFKRLIEALKTPGSGRLPTWDLSLESNVLPNMSVFHGAQAQIDLNVLLESPYRSYVVMLRKIVVFLMFGNLVTYIIMDMFGIGKGAGDAE